MKKIFAIMAVLSLLMVPCVSMAAKMSDADLAEVTGQSGVTIDISSLQIALGLGTFTYGDLDGFTTVGSLGSDFTSPGYLNVAFFPVPMHIGVGELELKIDIGTSATNSVTAVNIAGTIASPITVDLIARNTYLDSVNGAATDYVANNTIGSSYGPAFSPAYYNSAALTKNLYEIAISNISLTIPTFNIQISAH